MMKKYGNWEGEKVGGMTPEEAYKALGNLFASVRKIFEPQNSSIEAQIEAHKRVRSTLSSPYK
jgi:hypothetical protein